MTGRKHENSAAVIFGAQHPTGLITARALRGCGLDLIGVCFSDSPCLLSNLWSALVRSERQWHVLLQMLQKLIRDGYSRILLFPADDDCVKIFSDNRDALPPQCRIMQPERETVDLLLNKSLFYTWAQERGFCVPATVKVSSFKELDNAVAEVGYPFILKPHCRDSLWDDEFPTDKLFFVENAQQLNSLPQRIFKVAPRMLLQQWIPGGDDQVYFCLVQYDGNGRLANYFSGRKLVQWPPLGGSTAIAISDEQDEARDMTVDIFNEIHYQGLGSMEYKKDPRNGKLYIMEPTVGRNDLQSYLAVTGGVNLTANLCTELLGCNPHAPQRAGRAIWLHEHSVMCWFKDCLSRCDGSILRHILKLFRKPGFAYLSLGDIKPFSELLKQKFWKKCR